MEGYENDAQSILDVRGAVTNSGYRIMLVRKCLANLNYDDSA